MFDQLKYQRLIRFLISGGSAAVVTILATFIFTEFFNIWYLASSVIGFLFGFFYNFLLQKLWVFRAEQEKKGSHQLALFLLVNLINLGLNVAGIYGLVEIFGLWYILSQVIVTGLIAIMSFFLYRYIFNPNAARLDQ